MWHAKGCSVALDFSLSQDTVKSYEYVRCESWSAEVPCVRVGAAGLYGIPGYPRCPVGYQVSPGYPRACVLGYRVSSQDTPSPYPRMQQVSSHDTPPPVSQDANLRFQMRGDRLTELCGTCTYARDHTHVHMHVHTKPCLCAMHVCMHMYM